ncbi:MAG: hypothetical protein AB7F32_04460 [Victivallaceae bacterium]
MIKKWKLVLLGLCLLVSLQAGENLKFNARPLTAGKALLTTDGFTIERVLGIANFSPDLRLPIQLIYRSDVDATGIFGFGWSSPQLESSATPEKDGVLWVTPWGEKVRFFAKDKTDKDTLELYKEEMKGAKRFFAPYANWEADTAAAPGTIAETGDWTFSGKRDFDGWKFVYRDARLAAVTSPGGYSISLSYLQGKLVKISQQDQPFVELTYDGRQLSVISINGVKTELGYRAGAVTIMPKTLQSSVVRTQRPLLASLKTGDLAPVEFSYDQAGYLASLKQGDFVDGFKVETETIAERRANLQSLDKKSGVKHSGKVAGRLLSDSFFTYNYTSDLPGKVTLTNKLNQQASYDYESKSGVFKISEFSGKSYTIYYFMRYDVAYLGKVRQIVDGQKRTVVSYRYDNMSGKVTRIRDLAGNDINFEYNKDAEVELITRRAANQDAPEPVLSLRYDAARNPIAVSRLDAAGKPVMTTNISYSAHKQPIGVGNGQTATTIQYNRFGYPQSITDVFGLNRRLEFDRFNRLTAQTDHFGVRTEYTLNASGQVAKVERKDGKDVLTSLAVEYDPMGRPASYIDQAGRVKSFERDAFGRVVKELFPDETSVEYSYNAIGQLAQVLDQNQHEIKFDWSRFGIDAKTTAADQLTDYVYDARGMLAGIDSRFAREKSTDRSIRYEYDDLDRMIKVSYGKDEVETFGYDSWGKLIASTRGEKKGSYKYDYFGRMVEKIDDNVVNTYTYNPWGQRTSRVTKNGALTLTEKKTYDKFGRLILIEGGEGKVEYRYNDRNQLISQVVNGTPIVYEYTKYGQLKRKLMLSGN